MLGVQGFGWDIILFDCSVRKQKKSMCEKKEKGIRRQFWPVSLGGVQLWHSKVNLSDPSYAHEKVHGGRDLNLAVKPRPDVITPKVKAGRHHQNLKK